jgi:protein-disulfide isomerase
MLRTALALVAIAALAACQPQGKINLVSGDVSLGPADAKVTVVEYASPMCPHCKHFHDDHWPSLKADYIDAGKVKFIMRELPTAPAEISAAVISLARCAGQDKYFDVWEKGFARQDELFNSARTAEGPRPIIVALGRDVGFSEEQVQTCITDPANIARVNSVGDMAGQDGVTGTPALLVNGRQMEGHSVAEIWSNTKAAIDAALADAPAP